MNGLRIPRTPLVVDFWRVRDVPPRSLFFLTHMHAGEGRTIAVHLHAEPSIYSVFACTLPSRADHTSGLNAAWPYRIHCTQVTGRLLVKKFGINPELVVRPEACKLIRMTLLHRDELSLHPAHPRWSWRLGCLASSMPTAQGVEWCPLP